MIETGNELLDKFVTLGEALILIFVFVQICIKLSWQGHPFYHDPGSPKVVPYYIPFIGSSLSFWGDMVGFLTKWSKYYKSDIFSTFMGGKPFICVMDPLAAAHLVSGRIQELSWVEAKYRMMKNGLGGSHDAAHDWITTADLKNEHAIVEKHLLSGENLNKVMLHYQQILEKDIFPKLMNSTTNGSTGGEWTQGKLLDIVGKAIYYATIESVFGYRSLKNGDDYDTTMIFERRFPHFTGMNSQFMQSLDSKHFNARETHVKKMKDIFQKILSPTYEPPDDEADFFSDLIRDYGKFAHNKMELNDIARFHYLFFVASYYNTIPAGFWSVFQMLLDKNALEACRKEVLEVKAAKLQKGDKSEYLTLEELDSMDILDSLVTEATRLRSTTKMLRLRYAGKDFNLKLPLPISGETKQFFVKKGTYFIFCNNFLHRDPEIFQDPDEFKYNRFAKDSKTGKKPVFSKNGKRIHRPVDAFGGGLTMCPGRRFAVAEIKAIIAYFVTNYEFRWPEDKAPQPPVDNVGIVNTGMPIGDVDFEYRRIKKSE